MGYGVFLVMHVVTDFGKGSVKWQWLQRRWQHNEMHARETGCRSRAIMSPYMDQKGRIEMQCLSQYTQAMAAVLVHAWEHEAARDTDRVAQSNSFFKELK